MIAIKALTINDKINAEKYTGINCSPKPAVSITIYANPTLTALKPVTTSTASFSVYTPCLYSLLVINTPTDDELKKEARALTAALPGTFHIGLISGSNKEPTKSTRP